MKRILAIALAVLLTGHAYAEEDPTVKAADNANVAFVQCLEKVMSAVEKIQTESTRVMMIESAPDKCARNIRSPVVAKSATTADRAWDFGKFFIGALAQYKGQALIWGAVTSLVNRGYDATENTASQGLQTAENLGTIGMDHASKPPLVVHAPAPAAPSAETTTTAPTE